jgi:hypothetical protein
MLSGAYNGGRSCFFDDGRPHDTTALAQYFAAIDWHFEHPSAKSTGRFPRGSGIPTCIGKILTSGFSWPEHALSCNGFIGVFR